MSTKQFAKDFSDLLFRSWVSDKPNDGTYTLELNPADTEEFFSEITEAIESGINLSNTLQASLPVVPLFPVGTKFTPIGKNRSECTVTDFLVTRNLAGEVVKKRYSASHQFCGQTVTNDDVNEVTIARGIKQPA